MTIPKAPEHWHLKKEINLAHVIITLSMVVTTLMFAADLDKRIESNKKDIGHNQAQRIEDQRRSRQDQDRIYKQLDNVNAKLDRLLAK
jgi:hypothetical protein